MDELAVEEPAGVPGVALQRSIEEGRNRLRRTWPSLFATGAVGGIDVFVGLIALLLIESQTHSTLLGGFGLGVGFIALVLAGSELFTENFFVPVAVVVARRASVLSLLRLWVGTLLANLAAGWVMAALVMAALPGVRSTALHLGAHANHLGVGWAAFASALLAGTVMTLMTWMERGTESVPAKLIAAVSAAFVLGAGPLQHSVVTSLEMFSALIVGAPFGYLDWVRTASWAALGNLIGGLGFVTILRLVQLGARGIEEVREATDASDPEVDT